MKITPLPQSVEFGHGQRVEVSIRLGDSVVFGVRKGVYKRAFKLSQPISWIDAVVLEEIDPTIRSQKLLGRVSEIQFKEGTEVFQVGVLHPSGVTYWWCARLENAPIHIALSSGAAISALKNYVRHSLLRRIDGSL